MLFSSDKLCAFLVPAVAGSGHIVLTCLLMMMSTFCKRLIRILFHGMTTAYTRYQSMNVSECVFKLLCISKIYDIH